MVSEKKKLRHFQQLFDEADKLGQTGQHRASADKMEAVLAAPSVWTKHRYTAFQTFAQIITEMHIHTKNDIKMLKKRFIYNEEEPAVYRIQATLVVGGFELQKNEFSNAAELSRHALQIMEQSPPEDNDRVIIFRPYTPKDNANTVKSQIEKMRKFITTDLTLLEGGGVTLEQLQHLDTIGGKRLVCKSFKLPSFGEDAKHFRNRACAGGKSCDCCLKTSDELGVDSLLKCAHCKIVFYCSPECQKKDWKERHKQECRKKGQIEPGDDMWLEGLISRPDLNGRFVKVLGSVEGTENRYKVKLLGSAALPISVSGDKLVRLRPPQKD